MLTVPVTELSVGHAARLGYLNAQNLGLATWQVGSQVSTVESDATLTSVCAAFGGDYARLRTDCRLVGAGPPAGCERCTSVKPSRCSTSARSRITPRPTRRATCCSRVRSAGTAAAFTRASSTCGRTHAAPTRSRRTATSSCRTAHGPNRCPTWRSRTTMCAVVTLPRSAPSTKISASTSRAEACRRRSPSGSSSLGSSTRCCPSCPVAGVARRCVTAHGSLAGRKLSDRQVNVMERTGRCRRRGRIARRDHGGLKAIRGGQAPHRRRAVRRRSVRHRRHVHARRLLAVRRRGVLRRARDRVLEARQHVLAHSASRSRCQQHAAPRVPQGRSRRRRRSS